MTEISDIVKNISYWKALPPSEAFSALKEDLEDRKKLPEGKRAYAWSIGEILNPLQIYTYLKARFGPPNGSAMIVKNTRTADNLIHWEYQLQYNEHLINFTGFLFKVNIIVTKVVKNGDSDKILFLNAIQRDIANYQLEINKIKSEIERWYLIISPYYHLSTMIDENFSKLKCLKIASPVHDRPKINNNEESEDFQSVNENLHEAFSLGMTLKMIIPVWIESFINLIYFTLSKEEIRHNSTRYTQIKRQKIVARILTLPDYCNGFTKSIRRTELKKLNKIFQDRNKILHGGIDISTKASNSIYYDYRYIPLFNKHTYGPGFLQDLLLQRVNIKEIDKEITIGENFINLIISKLAPKETRMLTMMMNENILGWDEKRKISGCVIPPMVDLLNDSEDL